MANTQAILTHQPWAVKDSFYGQNKIFSFRKRQVISSRQDWLILPAQVANQNTGFTSLSCFRRQQRNPAS